MALIKRVNNTFPPLLSTFYCKCILNIAKFRTQQRLNNASDSVSGNKVLKRSNPFTQMIKFRQYQAMKSVLVKLPSFACLEELQAMSKHHVRIVDIFPYYTAKQQNFVLMELLSPRDVSTFRELSTYKWKEDVVPIVTQTYGYPKYEIFSRPRKKSLLQSSSEKTNIIPYSQFTIPLQNEITEQLSSLRCPSEQMLALYKLLAMADINTRLRFYTAREVHFFVSRLFSDIDIVPFGSSVNGFGQTGCDLDLLCSPSKKKENGKNKQICLVHRTLNFGDRENQKQFLEIVALMIKSGLFGSRNVRKILEAKVPIIKFFTENTNMDCDLSSGNMVALHMTELLYLFGELDYRVRPLICTIRKWARVTTLTKEVPGRWISNFALTLLVIFYLQTQKVIPPTTTLIDNMESVEKFELLKNQKKNKRSHEQSLYDLLYGFFEFYSIFDFEKYGISVRRGYVAVNPMHSALHIYNPLDEHLNVSQNVASFELNRVVNGIRNALNILVKTNESTAITQLLDPKTYRNKDKQTISLFTPNIMDSNSDDSYETNESKVNDKELFTTCDVDTSKKVEETIIK